MDRVITVIGVGSVSSPPDRCYLDLRVGATSDSVRRSAEDMAEAAQTAVAALGEAGALEVSTGGLVVRPERDHEGRPGGYRSELGVRAEAAVVEGSGEAVAALVEAAVAAAGDRLVIEGVNFVHSDPAATERGALAEAMADARARAEVVAQAAGVAIGGVVSVEQVAAGSPGPLALRAMTMEMADIPVTPGSLSTTVGLRATFEIA